MPRAQGFARGDFDTSFPIDDKFLDLRHRVEPARYYAATGVYWHIVASAWREAERKVGGRVCPDAPDQIADLQSVGLLDPDERLPNRAFMAYVGRAKRQRAKTSDRQRQHREGQSRVSHGESRVTERDKQLVTRGHNPARVQGLIGTGEEGSGTGGGPGEDTPPLTSAIDYIEARSGRSWHSRPGSKLYDTLAADVRDFGGRWQVAVDAVAGEHPDHAQLIFGASKRLHPLEQLAKASGQSNGGHTRTGQEGDDAFSR